MTEFLPAALLAVGAIGLTYAFCIRPMRRGHCAPTSSENTREDVDTEIRRLRNEVAALRRDLADGEARSTRNG